jgi:cell wall-associated NlpC family hydrolase
VPKCPAGFERLGVESCGSLDRDGDGIPNAVDQCPDQPEDFNHYKDEDGCPDEAERLQMVAAAAAASQAAANAQLAEQQRQQEEARQRAAAAEAARQREADAAAAEQQRIAREAYESEEASRRHRRTGGKVAIALGGSSVGISLFAIALSAAQNSAVKNGHFATVQALESGDSTGSTENSVALATGIVGLVGVAGGMALIFASPAQAPFGSAPTTGLVITPTVGGLGLGGRF